MKTIIIKIMLITSSMIFMLKTPMSMGVLLLMQTFLSTILMSKMMSSSWMPMIIFLMLIGGLLIIFMYMSSIASNEKFKPNFKIMMLIMIALMPTENMMLLENSSYEELTLNLSMESFSFYKMYNKKTFMITIMLFLYLLISMIAVTSIVKIFKGPLRSKL
uniref:NADH dehydrogenase subunit 6 n=1 Tax=Japananus hyalinus TaxID=1256066 RepID=A0A343BSX1_9HEMI|nr:NADH dehydrogenase subunit 6 [Japananus hyalinus]ARA90992.1 NADH dehydrogenase subunit 6 [Japananus hyalinus]